MNKKRVSIVRAGEKDNTARLKENLVDLLEPFGGIVELVGGEGRVVLLKPNLVSAQDYRTGAVTNPYLVKALVELLLECNPARVIIADGSAVGTDTQDVMQKTGYRRHFVDDADSRVELLDFKKETFIKKEVPGGELLTELRLPQVLDEVDLLINLPVPKTHDALPATLGLKNMKGVIHESDKKRFHRIGLAQAIVDLNKVCPAYFTIYDGTVAMEGLGPAHGDPVNLGLLLAADNVVAGDLITAGIMGIDKEEMEQIVLAEEQGLGCADINSIEVFGPPLTEVARPFARYSLANSYYEERGISVKGDKGCSGCRHTFDSFLRKLDDEMMAVLKDKAIYLGPADKIAEPREDVILIGSCLHAHRDNGYYLQGCPPHPEDIMEFLEEELGTK